MPVGRWGFRVREELVMAVWVQENVVVVGIVGIVMEGFV